MTKELPHNPSQTDKNKMRERKNEDQSEIGYDDMFP